MVIEETCEDCGELDLYCQCLPPIEDDAARTCVNCGIIVASSEEIDEDGLCFDCFENNEGEL